MQDGVCAAVSPSGCLSAAAGACRVQPLAMFLCLLARCTMTGASRCQALTSRWVLGCHTGRDRHVAVWAGSSCGWGLSLLSRQTHCKGMHTLTAC